MATAPGLTSAPEFVGETIAREQTSLWGDAWRRLRRNRAALVSTIFLAILIVVAIVAQFWTPYSYFQEGIGPIYQGPTAQHLLGLDDAGRDILSRIMVGAGVSLRVGIGAALVILVFGVIIGLIAGFYRGVVDTVVSTIINISYGIPDLLVALILVLLLGRSLGIIIFAIALTRWNDMARLVRGQTLALREREFVEAARAGGARVNRIIFRHIFPNALGPIIVLATYIVPQAILFEAFLSFLGLGVPPPTPSWGGMANDGFHAIRISPHIVLAPAIALSLTLMAFNFLGDGLRDALDPRQKR
jgi:oligopeptide transport system permease protein